ncbi:MAG: hypothetical protein IKA55_05655 [Akkermansia sp.]|nr:hypothetical protein [Akkermansia sp.]
MKRLGIYFYFDKNGWVGDFAVFYLEKLREFCEELCVVVNAPLSPEGEAKLRPCCDKLLIRDNVGFDSWAYKHALEHYGYEKLKEYDEVLLNNFTCYGPVYPLKEMFDEMESRECDFWGLSRHPEMNAGLTESPDSKICRHIQSYFISFRKKILQSPDFAEYWQTLKPVNNYNEAIAHHELRCSPWFEKRGYRSTTYMDFDYYGQYGGNATIVFSEEQLIRHRNPLVQRKAFFFPPADWLSDSSNTTARRTFDYIAEHTNYDVDLIWQDLLQTQKMSLLRQCLHLNYFLSEKDAVSRRSGAGVALVFFVYYEDEVDTCFHYMQSMPEGADIYIISAKPELLAVYREKLEPLEKYHCDYRLMAENRGRDVAAYLVTAADVYASHEYICCMHDKKTAQVGNIRSGKDFAYHCYENNLSSPAFVQNVLRTFEENPRLGMMVPPTIHFACWYPTLGLEMRDNEPLMQQVYSELGLTIPFDDSPVAAFGTMFWVRGKAFERMFRKTWTYADFPEEPLPFDNTILHALERMYQMAVQENGYYTAWLATSTYAAAYADHALYMLREIHQAMILGPVGFADNSWHLLQKLKRLLSTHPHRSRVIYHASRKYWINRILSHLTWGKTRLRKIEKKKHYKQLMANKHSTPIN